MTLTLIMVTLTFESLQAMPIISGGKTDSESLERGTKEGSGRKEGGPRLEHRFPGVSKLSL